MTDRLFQVFKTIQDRYLRDPQFADHQAVEAHVRRLRELQEEAAEDLRKEMPTEPEDAIRLGAEDRVIDREIIGNLPPRLVHEMRNNWAYFEGEVIEPIDPARVCHDELSTLHWYDRAAEAKVDVPEPAGNPGDYRGFDPIEDVALAPKMHWTGADKKAALEEAIRVYGIEPGQWFDLDWPPVAHLYDPGIVCQTELEPCDAHVDVEDNECATCAASVQEVIEQMAQWKWTTTLRINEIRFDADGNERSSEAHAQRAHELAATEQDPRQVVIGPPGEGQRW